MFNTCRSSAATATASTRRALRGANAYTQHSRRFFASEAPATPSSAHLTDEQTSALDKWAAAARTATHTVHEQVTVPRLQSLYSTLPTRAAPTLSLGSGQSMHQPAHISTNPGAIRDVAPKDGLALRPAHSLAFFPLTSFSEADLCSDGTEPLMRPPAPFARRMWVGGSFDWHARKGLEVGRKAVAVHAVESVDRKGFEEGRESGPMVFVNQRIRYYHEGHEAKGEELFTEKRTHVYLPPYKQGARRAVKEVPDLPKADYTYTWTPTPVTLFRFSALMFNAHHIHLDPLVAQHEGYPERLVHGPLTALMLIEALTYAIPSVTLTSFQYRAINPIVVNERQKIHIALSSDRQSAHLWAVDEHATVGMTGTVQFADAVVRQ